MKESGGNVLRERLGSGQRERLERESHRSMHRYLGHEQDTTRESLLSIQLDVLQLVYVTYQYIIKSVINVAISLHVYTAHLQLQCIFSPQSLSNAMKCLPLDMRNIIVSVA